MNRHGFTLLEALVALVVLGLAGVTCLDLVRRAAGGTASAETWVRAVELADEGLARLVLAPQVVEADEKLSGGFERHSEIADAGPGLVRLHVRVTLPGGGRFDVERLRRAP